MRNYVGSPRINSERRRICFTAQDEESDLNEPVGGELPAKSNLACVWGDLTVLFGGQFCLSNRVRTEVEEFERKSAEVEPSLLTCSNPLAFVWEDTPFAWPLDSRDLNGMEERMEVRNLESGLTIWLKFKSKTSFCETLGPHSN